MSALRFPAARHQKTSARALGNSLEKASEPYFISRMILAGTPAAITFGGISFDTKLPAPIIDLSPIFLFGIIMAADPMTQLDPIEAPPLMVIFEKRVV